jgi:hypothetical protein
MKQTNFVQIFKNVYRHFPWDEISSSYYISLNQCGQQAELLETFILEKKGCVIQNTFLLQCVVI